MKNSPPAPCTAASLTPSSFGVIPSSKLLTRERESPWSASSAESVRKKKSNSKWRNTLRRESLRSVIFVDTRRRQVNLRVCRPMEEQQMSSWVFGKRFFFINLTLIAFSIIIIIFTITCWGSFLLPYPSVCVCRIILTPLNIIRDYAKSGLGGHGQQRRPVLC